MDVNESKGLLKNLKHMTTEQRQTVRARYMVLYRKKKRVKREQDASKEKVENAIN